MWVPAIVTRLPSSPTVVTRVLSQQIYKKKRDDSADAKGKKKGDGDFDGDGNGGGPFNFRGPNKNQLRKGGKPSNKAFKSKAKYKRRR